MRFVGWKVLLTGLAVISMTGVPQRPSVYGKVTDPSDTPVGGVEVTARNVSTGEKKSATTDGNGRYELSELHDGNYRLTFKRAGFQRGEKQASVRAEIIPLEINKKLRIDDPTLAANGLNGVIEDEVGLSVAGVTVTAFNVQTGVLRTTTTDDDGFYRLEVPEGTYRLEIVATGFKKYEVVDVSVTSSQIAALDVALSAAALTTTVSVTADAATIDESLPLNTTVVSGRQIAELPMSQRDFPNLATLSPGVTISRSREATPDYTGVGISGQQGRTANFQIDGVNNNDVGVSTGVAVGRRTELPFGSIQEVTITEPVTAITARDPGEVINILTTRGSNELHGSGFYFHRNSSLDARDFFESLKSQTRGHQFGFTVSGPVVENRTFFFGGYEGHREFDARPQLMSVPSSSRLASARALLAASGLPENPLSSRLLKLFPPPDRPGDFLNRAINSPAVNNSDAVQTRLDHEFTTLHSAFLRYNFSRSGQLFPLTPSFFPGFRADFSGREQTLFASLASTFAITRINELDFAYRQNKYRFSPEDDIFNPASIGLETGVTGPARLGLPFIKITSFDALGAPSNLPGRETATTWQLKDVFIQIFNKETVTTGADFRRILSDSLNEAGTRGRVFFDGSALGDPLADFLAGFPAGDTGILRGDTRRRIALNHFSWFVQADLKPNSRLSLNAGLRYEFNGVPEEEQNRLSNFVPELGGLLPVGSNGLAKLYRNDLNNFAPRLGFAWSFTRSQRAFVPARLGVI